MPPTRLARYCCTALKEQQGIGRFVITGVRWEESVRRRATRSGLELGDTAKGERERLDPDNPDQELIHICPTKAQRVINPIIDWTAKEVWEFIREYKVRYCELYDHGAERLGCIGCPMGGGKNQAKQFERYPKYRRNYLNAFRKMLEENNRTGRACSWNTPEEVMTWWTEVQY